MLAAASIMSGVDPLSACEVEVMVVMSASSSDPEPKTC